MPPVAPMEARLPDALPDGDGWQLERVRRRGSLTFKRPERASSAVAPAHRLA